MDKIPVCHCAMDVLLHELGQAGMLSYGFLSLVLAADADEHFLPEKQRARMHQARLAIRRHRSIRDRLERCTRCVCEEAPPPKRSWWRRWSRA